MSIGSIGTTGSSRGIGGSGGSSITGRQQATGNREQSPVASLRLPVASRQSAVSAVYGDENLMLKSPRGCYEMRIGRGERGSALLIAALVGLGNAIVPAEGVFIEDGPQESEAEGQSR